MKMYANKNIDSKSIIIIYKIFSSYIGVNTGNS